MAGDDPAAIEMAMRSGFPSDPSSAEIGSASDLEATSGKLRELGLSAVCLLDSYRIEKSYMRSIKAVGNRVALLDDVADREVDCDILINSAATAGGLHYRGRIGLALLGLSYVPLSSQYRASPKRAAPQKVGTVLVTFGGTDHNSLSETLLSVLDRYPHRLKIILVVGAYYKNSESIRSAARSSRHEIELVDNPAGLFREIERSDLVVSAGGQTAYESAALGRPALCIGVSPNQYVNLDSLGREGVLVPMRFSPGKDFVAKLEIELLKLLTNESLRARMSEAATQLVDGQGATRIAMALLNGAAP
jgi:spore coat polysaccharide biosynthesis predicted glycosyltransferase SpsG